MLSLDYKIFTQIDSGTSAALLIKIMQLTGKGNGRVVYQRRVEKAREKKQNTLTHVRKFSLGSAGHRHLIGFGWAAKKSCLALCSGLTEEENDDKLQLCGTLVCTGTFQIH